MRAAAALAAAAAPAAAQIPGPHILLTIPDGTFNYTLTPAAAACGAGPHPLIEFMHARLMTSEMVEGYWPLIEALQAECYTILTCMDRPTVPAAQTAPWVLDSIDALKAHGAPGTDFSRVGVAGHSMGGGATVSALSKTDGSHNIRVGVAMHPWMAMAPEGSSNVRAPVLFTTGSADKIVPPGEVHLAYQQVPGAKVFASRNGVGHMNPMTDRNMDQFVIAMMNCHLQARQADCTKVYTQAGWGAVDLDQYESVPPSGPTPPAPPAGQKYTCVHSTCTPAAAGIDLATCQLACGSTAPPAPAPAPAAAPTPTPAESAPTPSPQAPNPPTPTPPSGKYTCVHSTCTPAASGIDLATCKVACGGVAPPPPSDAKYTCVGGSCSAAASGGTLSQCRLTCGGAPPTPPLPPAPPGNPGGPGSGPWDVVTPESVGLDTSALKDADKLVAKDATKRSCFLVVKGGQIVYESYTPASYNGSGHDGFSMTKTLGALIVLRAATQGKLDIDADITTTYGVPSPKSYPVTSRQIMAQALAGAGGPGETFAYDALGTEWIDHLPKVVSAATGAQPAAILKEFESTLGLSPLFTWGNVNSLWSGESYGTCRDYARYGQLVLNRGAWKGHGQFVDAGLVDQLGTPQKFGTYGYSNPCYGLLTWLNTDPSKYPGLCKHAFPTITPTSPFLPASGAPTDLKMLLGVNGQVTLVMPSSDAVVVSMGTTPAFREVVYNVYAGVCKVFGIPC